LLQPRRSAKAAEAESVGGGSRRRYQARAAAGRAGSPHPLTAAAAVAVGRLRGGQSLQPSSSGRPSRRGHRCRNPGLWLFLAASAPRGQGQRPKGETRSLLIRAAVGRCPVPRERSWASKARTACESQGDVWSSGPPQGNCGSRPRLRTRRKTGRVASRRTRSRQAETPVAGEPQEARRHRASRPVALASFSHNGREFFLTGKSLTARAKSEPGGRRRRGRGQRARLNERTTPLY